MTTPTKIEISVVGTLNNTPFRAKGRLKVDPAFGTKSGTVVFDPLPPGLTHSDSGGGSIADGICVPVGRCFVGARPIPPRGFVEPLKLLGGDFVSNRLTRLGYHHGTISQTEIARVSQETLRSDQLLSGELDLPPIQSKSFSTEILEVLEPDVLVSKGGVTLVTDEGREIPVRFSHVYRTLEPNRRLFRTHHGTKYVLCYDSTSTVRGQSIRYDTQSVIGNLRPVGQRGRKASRRR